MTARGIRPAGGSLDEFPQCVHLPVHVAQFGRGVVASTADWDAWRTRVEQSEMFEHFVRQVRRFLCFTFCSILYVLLVESPHAHSKHVFTTLLDFVHSVHCRAIMHIALGA